MLMLSDLQNKRVYVNMTISKVCNETSKYRQYDPAETLIWTV